MHAITETYESWKNCIKRNMGAELTLSFVQERIRVFSKKNDPETKKFIQLYGVERATHVYQWFCQLEAEMKAS